jgi:hypothetical protein
MMRVIIFGAGAALLAGAALAQGLAASHDYKPGDLISLGPNSYPAGAVYRIVDCDPATKTYRECRVSRQSPDPDGVVRPLTMDNYRDVSLVGAAQPPALAPAATALAAQPARQTTTTPARAAPVQTAQPQTAPAGGACPKSPYGGPVPGARAASPALFQQKITDSITMGAYGNFWYGVKLTNFSVGAPIRNTVGTLPGGGASRVNNGAPVNATMYPVSTTMSVCDGAPSGSSSWRTSSKKYLCFVSASSEWTCAASN